LKSERRFTNALQTPKHPSLKAVLTLHDRQVQVFGGAFGLLESAIAQPSASFGGELLHPAIADQAAAYLYHIAKNHPFIDGNKRTAFAVMETFLELNGYTLLLDNEAAYELVIQVAQGEINKEELTAKLSGAIAFRQS
jgi:death on curing protein